MFRVVCTADAVADIHRMEDELAGEEAKTTQLHTLEQLKRVSGLLEQNPFVKVPAYERLVGKYEDLYSRKLSYSKRIVYQIKQTPIQVENQSYDGIVKVLRVL